MGLFACSCFSSTLSLGCGPISSQKHLMVQFSAPEESALLYRVVAFCTTLATLLQGIPLVSAHLCVLLSFYGFSGYMLFPYAGEWGKGGELELRVLISGSPIMDRRLYNATSIFFNRTTRMTILLFSRFLVFTCGSPILVCLYMRLFRRLFFTQLS